MFIKIYCVHGIVLEAILEMGSKSIWLHLKIGGLIPFYDKLG